MQSYNAVILLGAPGCGKGTQGRTLGGLPGLFHCACGDEFRSISAATPRAWRVTNIPARVTLFHDLGQQMAVVPRDG